MPSPNHDRPPDSKTPTKHDMDATMGFESDPRRDAPRDSIVVTKQDRDLAFASALLRSGSLTERRLASHITRWTTHGHLPLSDYLLQRKAITAAQKDTLERQATAALERVTQELTNNPSQSMLKQNRTLLSRIDPSGKLCKLLGIADTSMLPSDEVELRTVGSRYTLLRRLGQGGIGTVWLARDENLRRYVAVKEVTHQGDSDDPALLHFRREAEITGQLEHPGIVPVHQFGTDDTTGRAFYAMRFVGKRTLQDAIIEYHERRVAGNVGHMLMHRLLTAFENVCHAVAHAHSRKIIHRDLKPENIAIDSFGQIVVLDWGLAKINDETGMYDVNGQAERGDLHSVQSTRTGRVLGTPSYMAPEQAAGRLEAMDELTDVYGLGGILYAMLTGEAPHERMIESECQGLSSSEVLSKIVAAEVTPPVQIHDEVSPELSAICTKALANKRYLRYASATELSEDVERYRAGSTVVAYSAPIKQRAKRWMATHPTMTQMILLILTLTVLGTVAIGYTARRGRLALQQARYQSLTEFARDLELNLEFETQELVQDISFITEFPLMQVIARSQRAGVDEMVTSAAPPSTGSNQLDIAEVSPEEWLRRHGQLLDGLLNANPSYLVATTVRYDNPTMTELMRSERLHPGTQSRRVPKQQLYEGDHPESDNAFYELRPGQVLLTTGDQLSENVPTLNRSPFVLVAICPIFDDTGTFFGINVIELDLRPRLDELFHSATHDDVEVFITNSKGEVALHYRDGVPQRNTDGQPISASIPELEDFFAIKGQVPQQATDKEAFGDNATFYATRILLGDQNSTASFGIVTRTTSAGSMRMKDET